MPRKKKESEIIVSADLAEAVETKPKKSKKTDWPKINKGNHLTVITHENGKTELVWDDAALAKEVKEAIESYELENLKPAVKAKAVSRKKKNLVK